MTEMVTRYRKPTRILHWVHSGAFVLLFLTGLFLFIPQLGFIAQDSWTRVIHRVAVLIFVVIPIVYIIMNPRATAAGIKEAFKWGKEDLGWLRAAPRYYGLCEEESMPPQGHMNTGQKMWWLIVIVFGAVFIITGWIMWFGKTTAPSSVLQWSVFAHDVAFIISGSMFFVHLYMMFHPLMKGESWGSMAYGKVSAAYAKSHHGKWYKTVTGRREPETE